LFAHLVSYSRDEREALDQSYWSRRGRGSNLVCSDLELAWMGLFQRDMTCKGLWRVGRVVEGTPLLRVQARKGLMGSNPILSAILRSIKRYYFHT
jgi:hypothetical protein